MFELNGHSREIIEKFRTFGLCEYESRVFFTLQVLGKTKACDLWKKAGVPQERIYYMIQRLMMKGLVETTQNYPLEVRAKSFVRFANDFMNERKCVLREIDGMIEEYREVAKKNFNLVRVVV